MSVLGPVFFVALVAYGAWTWHRSGLRMPVTVHLLGLFGLGVGIWMAGLHAPGEVTSWPQRIFSVVIMPVLAYAGFFAYSGRLRRARASAEADAESIAERCDS